MKTATPTRDTLDATGEDYLDGMLTGAETRAFEARLVEPEVTALVAEALALRSLLTELPADPVPEGLTDRIEHALGVAEAAPGRFPRLRAALSGAAWALRGPSHAAPGEELAPVALAAIPINLLMPRRAPSRPLWRRALGLGA